MRKHKCISQNRYCMKTLEDEQRKNMPKKIAFCKEYKNEKA